MLLGTSKACSEPDKKGAEPTFRVRRKKIKREWKEKRKKGKKRIETRTHSVKIERKGKASCV